MQKYHLRRTDKQIKNIEEIYGIIQRQEYLTLALCKNDDPYLVSLNYGFDLDSDCFYFHCASEGKKLEYLQSNPAVYGEILEELYAPTDGIVDMIFSPSIYEGDYLIGIGKNVRTIT